MDKTSKKIIKYLKSQPSNSLYYFDEPYISLDIDEDECIYCSFCSDMCPVGAITGEIKSPYTIDPSKCIKCGACESDCPFGAIEIV